ncbi:MAG TPA: N-acetylmuramoyl-L-alanine amidase [Actinomycetota bacterium]|nr:N-acetylmuramoyl-L-alanine amidase [Actinomycetota bacterium]
MKPGAAWSLAAAVAALLAVATVVVATRGDHRPAASALAGTAPAPASAPAPATPVTPSAPPTPGTTRTVVIDPGHNGQNWRHTAEIGRIITVPTGQKPCDTTGTTSTSGYTESAYNLDVAQRVAPVLSGRGVRVLLTRTDDAGWGPCIDQRVDLANGAGADAVVSIHADGWPAGRGFYILYAAPAPGTAAVNDPLAQANRRLAVAVRHAIARETSMPTSTYGGQDGLKTVPWPTLYHVPEVLVETANMRSPTDAALLDDPAFRARMAAALADGVSAFLAGR